MKKDIYTLLNKIYFYVIKYLPIIDIARTKDANLRHIKKAIKYVNIKKKKCLVVGCNTGKDCNTFLEFGAQEVHGVDVIDNIGNDFINSKIIYHKISAERMDNLQDNFFDLTYCFATLEHIALIDLALAEMVRVTKPGGIIYSFAAPLWNSAYGHHKYNFFKNSPWIHLLKDEGEILHYCKNNNILDPSGTSMENHIAYMFDKRFFNMTSSEVYCDVCNSLNGVDLIMNKLKYDDESMLTSELFEKLNASGYSHDELLANSHTFIARKIFQ